MTKTGRTLSFVLTACTATAVITVLLVEIAATRSLIFYLVSLMAAPAALVGAAAFGLSSVVAYRSGKLQFARRALMTAVLLSLPFVLAIVAIRHQSFQAYLVGDTVVEALEKYRAQFGRYPESLRELVPDNIAKLPSVRRGLFRSADFEYEAVANAFELSVRLGGDVCRRTAESRWSCYSA
jgi:hypothetical protein